MALPLPSPGLDGREGDVPRPGERAAREPSAYPPACCRRGLRPGPLSPSAPSAPRAARPRGPTSHLHTQDAGSQKLRGNGEARKTAEGEEEVSDVP